MEIKGTVKELLQEQSGESRNGQWRKQDFIIETEGQYPKNVCITMWGDKIDQFDLKEGETVTVHFNLESREFKGRWYTDVKAWKIDKDGEEAVPPDTSGAPPHTEADMPPNLDEEEDDTPF